MKKDLKADYDLINKERMARKLQTKEMIYVHDVASKIWENQLAYEEAKKNKDLITTASAFYREMKIDALCYFASLSFLGQGININLVKSYPSYFPIMVSLGLSVGMYYGATSNRRKLVKNSDLNGLDVKMKDLAKENNQLKKQNGLRVQYLKLIRGYLSDLEREKEKIKGIGSK